MGELLGCLRRVWRACLVALSALNTMEWGRRYLHRMRPYSPAVPAAVRAGTVATFWAALHDFADLGVPRKGWGAVPADHSFLFIAGGRLRVADGP